MIIRALILPCLLALSFTACQTTDETPPPDSDGDLDSDSSETDVPLDGDATEQPDSEDEENQEDNMGWDYREAWQSPQETWSECPQEEYQAGVTLKDKAAYYDWIVPALHQVPRDSQGHEDYSRVFRIRCDANVPDTIVTNEQLPSCSFSLSENNGLWTSLYVASQAFRYASTGEADALEQLKRTLNGTYQMLLITGQDGLYTRDFRDPSLPQQFCIEDEEPYASATHENEKYARYSPPDEHMVGNSFVKIDDNGCFMDWDTSLNDGNGGWRSHPDHCTDPRFAGFCWQRNVSKDEYAGHMFSAGIVAKLVDDPDVRRIALDILSKVGPFLVENNFWITDFDGRPTRYGSAHAMSLDEMPGSNAIMALAWIKEAAVATGDENLLAVYNDCLLQLSGDLECIDQPFETPKDYREYLDTMGLALGCNSNYDTISIAELNYFNLIWFEENTVLRQEYRDYFRQNTQGPDSDGRDLWREGNPFRNMMLVSRMAPDSYDPTEVKTLIEEAICTLKRFPTDTIRRAQDASGYEPWCDSERHGSLAEQPIPVEERCSSVFEWWGDPNQREVCSEDLKSANPPAGFLLPYWMGRYFGYISEEM